MPSLSRCLHAGKGDGDRANRASGGLRHVMTLGEQRDGTLLALLLVFFRAKTVHRAATIWQRFFTRPAHGSQQGRDAVASQSQPNAITLDQFWGFRLHAKRQEGCAVARTALFHVHGLFVASHAALVRRKDADAAAL